MLRLPELASVFLLLPSWPWPPVPLSRLTVQVGSRGTPLSGQEVISATSKVAVQYPPVYDMQVVVRDNFVDRKASLRDSK